MSDDKVTTMIDGVNTVTRVNPDTWVIHLSTAAGVKLQAKSQRADARTALLELADSLNNGVEPYLIDTLSRS